MDKNLPIQFFEKRRVLDLQKTPGGGNGDPPKFVLDGQALAAHSKELDVDVDVLTEAFEAHSSNYHDHCLMWPSLDVVLLLRLTVEKRRSG